MHQTLRQTARRAPRARCRGVPVARLAVFLVLALACVPCGLGAEVEILVLQTADVHGAFGDPTLPDEGDWRRLAAAIRRLREEHGPERTLLVDCGDTLQGSLAARVTAGRAGTLLLQSLAFDAWVPGNHDLDFGVENLLERCRAERLPVLCGNMALLAGGRRHDFRAWQSFDRGGARIAVLGATASYMRQWHSGETARRIEVETAAAMLDRILPEVLAGRPDLVILAAHQGWLENDPRNVNEIRDIALRYPEIDLILGAHTHRPVPGLRIGPAAWYVQPGALATHVAAVRARVDLERHCVLELNSELVPSAETPDETLGPEVDRLAAEVREFAARPVCRLREPVPPGGTPGINCAVSELLCRALAEASGAEVALHGVLGRAGLPAGEITERDLFALVPYENSITVAELTPAELEEVVAEQVANRTSYVYCGVWGAEFALQGPAAGAAPRARLVALPGRAGPPPERLRVALNSYTAAGGGGRFPRLVEALRGAPAACRDTGISTRDAVRAWLRRHADEAVVPHAWIKGRLSLLDPARAEAAPADASP